MSKIVRETHPVNHRKPPFLERTKLPFYRDICNLFSLTHLRSFPNGLQLHSHVLKSGLQTIPLISHHLINFYSKNQLPLHSRQIFYETPQKSSTTWSSVVSSFAQNELLVLAIEYFCRMLGAQLRPDDHIYPSVAKSCAILNRFDVGKSVHCPAVKTGYEFDVFVGSSVVDVHVKCGEIRDAQKVFHENPKKNVVSWRGMIYGYTQLGQDEEAMRQFKPIS